LLINTNIISVFENDPASIPLVVSDEGLQYYISLGPCQPIAHDLLKNTFPKTYEKSGHLRSFNECHYYKKNNDGQHIKRSWLSYSPYLDRIFCSICKLFGLPDA